MLISVHESAIATQFRCSTLDCKSRGCGLLKFTPLELSGEAPRPTPEDARLNTIQIVEKQGWKVDSDGFLVCPKHA